MFKKILALVVLASVSTVAFAQGTVNFDTKALGASALVTTAAGGLATGAAYYAQLFAGPGTTAEAALVAVGNPVNFRAGGNIGYVQTTGNYPGLGTAVDPVVTIAAATAGGPVTVQLRAWSSAYTTYAAAKAAVGGEFGQSDLLSLLATGNPNAAPPGTPVDLIGLKGFTMTGVPEPSSIALLLLGGAALLIRRRK